MLLHQNETLTRTMLQYDMSKIKDRYKEKILVLDAAIITGNSIDNAQKKLETPAGKTDAEHYYYKMAETSESILADALLQNLNKNRHNLGAELIEKLTQEKMTEEQWAVQNAKRISPKVIAAMREKFIRKFGFTVITSQAIKWIKQQAGDGPYVEIGSGNGYLANELNKWGFVVFPTEPNNCNTSDYDLGRISHMKVEHFEGIEALDEYEECDVLWSWPQPHPRTQEILRHIIGRKLVYIGDLTDIKKSDPDTFQTLQSEFVMSAEHANNHFQGINEVTAIFLRR